MIKDKKITGQGGQDGQGFSLYTKKPICPLEVKKLSTLSTLSSTKNSSDDIQNFILALEDKKTDWQTLSDEFGEDKVQKAMDEGLIYEANLNQIKIVE